MGENQKPGAWKRAAPLFAAGARRIGWDRAAWAAILIGAALRLIWILVVHPPYEHLYRDMEAYVGRATRLALGGELTRYDAFFPPGTHMLLAAPIAIFRPAAAGLRGAAVLWWLLSSLVPFLAWRLTRRALTIPAAAVTAVLVALYPPFILYGGFFTSETPSIVLLLGSLLCAYCSFDATGRAGGGWAAASGALGGAAIITRPQLGLNLVVIAAIFLIGSRTSRLNAAVVGAAAAAVVAAGVVHNSLASKEPVNVTGTSGITFFQGHCDTHLVTAGTAKGGGVLSSGNPVAFERHTGRDYTFPNHQAWDQSFFYAEGLDCIRRDGLGHVAKLGNNLLDATFRVAPWPLSDTSLARSANKASNFLYSLLLPLIVAGSLAALRWRPRVELPRAGVRDLLLQLLCFIPPALLYSSETRHRVPYDVFGLALLAWLVCYSVTLIRRRTSPATQASPTEIGAPS